MIRRSLFFELNLAIFLFIAVLVLSLSAYFIRSFSLFYYNQVEQQSKTVLKAVHIYLRNYLNDSASKLAVISEIEDSFDGISPDSFGEILKANMVQNNSINSFQVIDRDGVVRFVYPYNEEVIDNDVTGLKYFQEGILENSFYWSTAVLSANANEPVTYVTHPYGDGLICAEISMSALLKSIHYIDAGSEGDLGLIDEQGTYILHTNPEMVRRRVFSFFNFSPDGWDEEGIQSGTMNNAGEKYFFAAMKIDEISGTLIYYESFKYIETSISSSVLNFLIIALVFFLFFMLIAFFLGRLLMKPVNLLNEKVNLIAFGDYVTPLERDGYREFHTLIESVNAMSRKIQKRENALILARNEAEEANKLKLQFLANMSHELRTPLNGIFGMTDLLNHTKLDKVQRQYLKYLSTSSENLLGLIQDLLDFSRLDNGKLSLHKEPVRLKEIFDFLAEQYAREAEAESLEFKYSIDIPDETVICDRVRLNQIVANLLSNALKFTQQGFIRLNVTREGGELIIEIEDSGIGIDEVSRVKIFQSFIQLEDAFSKKYQGLGLGLAITDSLIKLHDGRLELVSSPGKGSLFKVFLPYPEVAIS